MCPVQDHTLRKIDDEHMANKMLGLIMFSPMGWPRHPNKCDGTDFEKLCVYKCIFATWLSPILLVQTKRFKQTYGHNHLVQICA